MAAGGINGNNLLGSRYRILRELGRGGFGHTYLAEDINRFSELCVLKEFFPQVDDDAALEKAKQLFEREADVLYQLNHPQIPRFRELLRVHSSGRGRLFLVQDYVEGPTYQELLETRLNSGDRFSEAEVIRLLQQVLPVLEYLHSIGVVHRDIAPDNLILRNADGLPVLIDFGGVKQLVTAVQQQVSSSPTLTRLGKVGFAPEEQLESGYVTPSADLYALAVTALVLLTGQPPNILYDQYAKRWRWQDHVTLSPRLTKVLEHMLAPRVGDRYSSATAVAKALSTPDMYSVPATNSSNQQYQPTLAVVPGRSAPPPSTIVGPPKSTRKQKQPRPDATNGCVSALFGLLLLFGAIGLVWWIASRWDPNEATIPPETANSADTELAEPSLSREEQARRNALQQRLRNLQVNEQFLVDVADQLFYNQFPEMQGQSLSNLPEDESLRAEWASIANEILNVLEENLSAEARQRLGKYNAADREQWRQQVNQRYVSSRAVNDLADAKFTYLYPQSANQNFIDQPIGQIWHGLAYDRVQGVLSGAFLEKIQFDSGEFSHFLRDQINPGEGRIYVLNLKDGQLMRLNLQASPQSAKLSLYVPNPNDEVPYLVEDSNNLTWSGRLPQSGYYEITVVSAQQSPLDYGLNVSVDNVTTTPTTPEAEPEDKN